MRAVAGHLGPRTEAYVANHHNPNKCQATLGFIGAALLQGIEVQRLEDAEGFALGCLHGLNAGFTDARFVSLGADAEAARQAVRNALFREKELSPMKQIQIFRLTRPRASSL
ncbi:unnamed protein product [Symbiodinium natans]|uniref:Uncharacterized protein n=1 Tax=Symbiodinium natans TaxID=878477 RepID=A0A812V5U2_9DINO|nr:unnamed protein product [Symbiodinium natans]